MSFYVQSRGVEGSMRSNRGLKVPRGHYLTVQRVGWISVFSFSDPHGAKAPRVYRLLQGCAVMRPDICIIVGIIARRRREILSLVEQCSQSTPGLTLYGPRLTSS